MDTNQSPLLFIISEPVGSPIANEVAFRLADQGVRTWIGSLAPGGELSDTAMEALRGSAATLLIFDASAARSDHALRHLQVARQTGKPLIPLRVQNADTGVLAQELSDVRWIDWNSPDAAAAEIRRRAYEYGSPHRGPAPTDTVADQADAEPRSRRPRIEVLGAGAAAATAAHSHPAASAPRPQPQSIAFESDTRPEPVSSHDFRHAAPSGGPAAAAPRRRKSLLASPTMLLALLALAVIVGALLYNSSLFQGDGDSADREVAERTVTQTPAPQVPPLETDTAPAAEGSWGPASEGTEPDLPAVPETAAPEAAAPEAPAPVPAPREAAPAPAPREVATAQIPRPPVAAPAPATPEPAEAPAPPASGGGSAAAAVRSFYSALSGGNGAAAAQHVIPAKRGSGPLSAGSLTRYYSSFRRPLRIRSVTPVDADTVRVAYDYVLSDGRLCQGQASVNTVQSGGRTLVSGIRTRGPC